MAEHCLDPMTRKYSSCYHFQYILGLLHISMDIKFRSLTLFYACLLSYAVAAAAASTWAYIAKIRFILSLVRSARITIFHFNSLILLFVVVFFASISNHSEWNVLEEHADWKEADTENESKCCFHVNGRIILHF